MQGRKQFDPRGASRVCKARMWRLALDIAGLAAVPAIEALLKMGTYAEVKRVARLDERRAIVEEIKSVALKGWVRNDGGEDFGMEGVHS